MGDAVTIAASWRADALRRTTVEDFLSRWTAAMDPAALGRRQIAPVHASPTTDHYAAYAASARL
jgi:hypothetical protein